MARKVKKKAKKKIAASRPKAATRRNTKTPMKKGAGGSTSKNRNHPAKTNRKPEPKQEIAEKFDVPKPLPKTRLSEAELAQFRQILLAKREELVGDVNHLTHEALKGSQPGGAGTLSHVPIHPADMGSDNWEQEFTLGLIDTEREVLKQIDDALQRIEERTYGICAGTRKPIGKRRLRAKPWARYCIEYARQMESGRSN